MFWDKNLCERGRSYFGKARRRKIILDVVVEWRTKACGLSRSFTHTLNTTRLMAVPQRTRTYLATPYTLRSGTPYALRRMPDHISARVLQLLPRSFSCFTYLIFICLFDDLLNESYAYGS